ncbi:endonuclease-reverse transcriptase [Elysia marginata]|uniref:Endonuclease-reverse transcriptase n=1 Tax=Elysia marginata TaxID=1093978 RepID=A0AAV4F3G8_9GAST|nr:endonuclease-reverse transcriptase [Elysia marginata]
MFQQVAKLSKNQFQPKNQCANNKNGVTSTKVEDIFKKSMAGVGKALFRETFETGSENQPSLADYEHEPEILREEVIKELVQLKNGRSPGLDLISGKILKSLEKQERRRYTFYVVKSGKLPMSYRVEDRILLCYIIKSGSIMDCSNYRTIALICHAS